jgi:hypothetical protein
VQDDQLDFVGIAAIATVMSFSKPSRMDFSIRRGLVPRRPRDLSHPQAEQRKYILLILEW